MKPVLLSIISFCLVQLCLAQKSVSKTSQPKIESVPANNMYTSVAIVNFKLERLSGHRVHISWHTDGADSNGFILERKLGDNDVYQPVSFIPSKSGSSESIADYDFTDKNPFDGISYYRIRQKDGKGILFYSMAKTVKGKNSEEQ